MKEPEIDRGDLLNELRNLNDDLGCIPKVRDVHRKIPYDYETYRRRFGGLTAALEAAGITPDPAAADRGPGPIGEEVLLEELQRLGDQLGRPPKIEDVQREGRFSHGSYYNHFESFRSALEAAGFEPRGGIRRQDLLDALHALAEEVGKPPTSEQMREQGQYSATPYRNEFGGWVQALEAAGLNE